MNTDFLRTIITLIKSIMYFILGLLVKVSHLVFVFEPDGVTGFTFTVYPGIPSSIPVSSYLSYETLSRRPVSIIIVTLAVGETLNSNTLTHKLNQFDIRVNCKLCSL